MAAVFLRACSAASAVRLLAFALVLGLGTAARAGEETAPAPKDEQPGEGGKVVVTATREETPEREVGSSVTLVDAEEIARTQKTSVKEALRGKPGLDVVGTGGPGGTASLFVRGAPSDFTVVMIDGVKVADPMSTGRSFDPAHLTPDGVERVEVLRGPQSTLYGSDAMGGVVNVITRRGEGPFRGELGAEGGSFGTWRESLRFGAGERLFNYSLAASHLKTDGISSASAENGNTERDGYRNASVSGRFGLTPAENLSVDLIVRHTDTRREIDDWDFVLGRPADDRDHFSDELHTALRAQTELGLFEGLWRQKLGLSSSWYERNETNDLDNPDDNLRSDYRGRILKVDWQHSVKLHEVSTLTAGLEYEVERGESLYRATFGGFPWVEEFPERDEENWAVFLQPQLELFDCLYLTAGVRHDQHGRFGGQATWRATAAWLIDRTGTKLKGSAGTGFKAPSLYQLHSSYGDPGLDPQESFGWDAGVEQEFWSERASLGVTWFGNRFTDMIDFDFLTSTYGNIGEARTRGVEVSARVEPIEDLRLRAFYTFTETENLETGEELLRRPRHKYSAEVSWLFPNRRGDVTLGVAWVGERDDVGGVELASYTVANLAASYAVTERLRLCARVENLFDEEYEEVGGYGTPGLSAYAGVKVSF